MNRNTFLTLGSLIALAVGVFALSLPATLLASKGVLENAAAMVWMRQMGVALIAIGLIAWRIRAEPDSPTLRAFLLGNAVLQLGLLPQELLAWRSGVLTQFWGVLPNSVLHVLLAGGFLHFATTPERI